jgi:hypothetical protein
MIPALVIAAVLFAGFLLVLALIGFAAYRFAVKREGAPMGAAGGCALAAVLLGAGLFAMVGFVVVAGLLFARHVHLQERERGSTFEYELEEPEEEPAEEPTSEGDVLDGALDRGWAQHPEKPGDVREY